MTGKQTVPKARKTHYLTSKLVNEIMFILKIPMTKKQERARGWLVSLLSTGLVIGLGTGAPLEAQQPLQPGNAMTVRSD
ncbi:hypothetical protein, partial [Arcanobacterium phocae]|uniref:hypothetical protein n=1 Tax=Arcanobacterium phocae TaxID=131112 RepID=UPI001C12943E